MELEQMLKKYPKAHYDRNKGIGEMGSEAFSIAAFGENARLVQFTMEDVSSATTILEILLGKKNEERTEYIFENVDFSVVEGE
jgi:DNA gyrase/topoisomerase IV subunit B